MKIKTPELIGPALDWAVAKCEGIRVEVWPDSAVALENVQFFDIMEGDHCEFSTNWTQGGPIIEREDIALKPDAGETYFEVTWFAETVNEDGTEFDEEGPTPLIAAMRCYCCAILGDEIEIPQELQPCQQQNL